MKEEWRNIEGYEGKYEVSNRGNMKSLNYNHTGKEKIMKPQKNRDGYLIIGLWKDGKAKWYLVHRLVASVFCENPHGYTEVNHLDEDKTNNCADNLEWCSRSYNNTYNGKAKKAGKKIAEKLSKPVIAIDRITGLIVEFPSAKEAERMIGIDHGNICNCLKGRLKSAGGFYWYYADTE